MLKSIVLLSGGLDSTVSLACALRESEVDMCLTFDYGQLAAFREIQAATALTAHYDLRHQVIAIPFLGDITNTALVKSDLALPEPKISELDESTDTAAQVWVPNRNAIFIHIAAAYAESRGAQLVVAGFNSEEAAKFPDNSIRFVQAINETLQHSTLQQVKVVSYTQRLHKEDIINLGLKLSVPFSYIWSCYRGEEKMCGRCESCLRFKRAAAQTALDLDKLRF